MPMASSENTSDPWGGDLASVSVHGNIPSNARSLVQAKLKPKHVPDDWDDDDEEEEEIDAQRIWETANTKSPMPQLVISRPSTSATVVSPPPTAVIQAPMRILKRQTPTATPSSPSSASPSPVSQTLAEREARYQEARQRIFGSSKPSEQDDPKTPTPPPAPIPTVVHNASGLETDVSSLNLSVQQGPGTKRGRKPQKP